MKYCIRCGTALEENAKFCTHCGMPANGTAQQATEYPYPPGQAHYNYKPENPIEKLSSRLRVSAILLLITAILQILGGLSCIGAGIGVLFAIPWVDTAINEFGEYIGQYNTYIGQYAPDGDYYLISQFASGVAIAACIVCIIVGAFMFAVCIVNFVVSKRTFRYTKKIQQSPVGIVEHFQSAGRPIAVLVLNILGGGAIGIVGAAFGLAARCYVTGNQQQFLNLEQQVR